MAFPYKTLVISFTSAIYLLETYFNIRQHNKLNEVERPIAIQDIVEDEVFQKSRAYGLDKSYFRFFSGFYNNAQTIVFLYYDLIPYFWNISADLLVKLGYNEKYEILHSIIFFNYFTLFNVVMGLPLTLYSTFVIEEKHGFNKSTFKLFVIDQIKSLALTFILGGLFLSGFLKVIEKSGANFAIYLWLFMVAVQLIGITLYPTVIQPLFNKFTPLEDGDVKTEIEALASRIDFPLTKLLVIDGSTRTSHSNAYFFGLFKNKRIVLFDTLLADSSLQEILAIVGHELGHWKLGHIKYNLLLAQVQLFVTFYLFQTSVTNKDLYESFGFYGAMPVFIGFILFQFLSGPVDFLMTFFMHSMSRKFEFQADKFAVDLGYAEDLRSGLIKLQKKNLGDMNPDPLYSAYHFSHPPLVERLSVIPTKNDTKKSK